MADLIPRKMNIPPWVWLSMIPSFGGIAIIYRAKSLSNKLWICFGVGLTFSALALGSAGLVPSVSIWLFQVGTAFWLHQRIKQQDSLDKFKATFPVDINTCSKHDLVYHLDMPIVYANDIEFLKNAGYIFTYLEELREIAGLPESYLKKIAHLVTFSYDINRELDTSWRRVNSYSVERLREVGLEASVAEKILSERQAQGNYSSVMDILRRTGLPLKAFVDLI